MTTSPMPFQCPHCKTYNYNSKSHRQPFDYREVTQEEALITCKKCGRIGNQADWNMIEHERDFRDYIERRKKEREKRAE